MHGRIHTPREKTCSMTFELDEKMLYCEQSNPAQDSNQFEERNLENKWIRDWSLITGRGGYKTGRGDT